MSALEGLDAAALAKRVGAPAAYVFGQVGSTMDEAHRLAAEGAPSGALVVADTQRSGRGRLGRPWASAPGLGLWLSVLWRGIELRAIDVLSIRIGLQLAEALDALAGADVHVKWPNDLLIGRRKLGGVLVETRWRGAAIEWVAVGVGINLVPPGDRADACGLQPGATRLQTLDLAYPAIAQACRAAGELGDAELASFGRRDAAAGAAVIEPAEGIARGITPTGALVVHTAKGRELYRRGSLVFASEDG